MGLFGAMPAQAVRCEKILLGENNTSSDRDVFKELNTIHDRLAPHIAAQFDFKIMNPPTVREARKHKTGLTKLFLDSISKNSKEDEATPVFPLLGPQSNQFVRVYRVVTFDGPLQGFDISHNYKHGNAQYAWRGDFVTHEPSWTWAYAEGSGKDILAEYLVPARLLEIDLTTHKVQEPYYVISQEKMNALGIRNVGVFLNRLATVAKFKIQDPTWYYDSAFPDFTPGMVRQPPKDLADKKINWVDDATLNYLIKNGEF